MPLLGLNNDDYQKTKAEVIWAEAEKKLDGWRKHAIKNLLLDKENVKTEISNYNLFQAHEILSENYENQYFKIEAFEKHLLLLSCVAVAAVVFLIILNPIGSDFTNTFGQKHVLYIPLFGIMGAVVSGMLSARGGTQARIPEQQISNSMTFAKLAVGAISAFVVYVFITSGLLNIKSEITEQLILAASFAAGFTERLVNRTIETLTQGESKK